MMMDKGLMIDFFSYYDAIFPHLSVNNEVDYCTNDINIHQIVLGMTHRKII